MLFWAKRKTKYERNIWIFKKNIQDHSFVEGSPIAGIIKCLYIHNGMCIHLFVVYVAEIKTFNVENKVINTIKWNEYFRIGFDRFALLQNNDDSMFQILFLLIAINWIKYKETTFNHTKHNLSPENASCIMLNKLLFHIKFVRFCLNFFFFGKPQLISPNGVITKFNRISVAQYVWI